MSPALLRRPGERDLLLCVPLKNGNSWWLTALCAAGGSDAEMCRRASWDTKDGLVDRLFRDRNRGDDEINATVHDASIMRLMITRSPVTRVLAAWLTWVGRLNSGHAVESTFPEFVDGSMRHTDEHWRLQSHYCGIPMGAEFRFLKTEHRSNWGADLLADLHLTAAGRVAGLEALQGRKEGNVTCCPCYACPAARVMTKYYTPAAFEKVISFYQEDTERFGYQSDVRTWRETLENLSSDSLRLGEHEGKGALGKRNGPRAERWSWTQEAYRPSPEEARADLAVLDWWHHRGL